MEENKKNPIIKYVVLLLGFMIVSSAIYVGFTKYYESRNAVKPDEEPVAEEHFHDEYVYKIRYDFGQETYIYLLDNKKITVATISPVYDVVPGCDCIEATGEIDYDEKEIEFSDSVKEKVITVLDELYKMAGNKSFDADKLNLSTYQDRVLIALVIGDEDHLTIEDNISYSNIINGSINAVNLNTSNNNVINNISNYLNNVVNKDIEYYSNLNDGFSYDLKLEHAYSGPHSLSFKYTVICNNKTIVEKGYNFNYNGDYKTFDLNGYKDNYFKSFMKKFRANEEYSKYSSSFFKSYEDILYENIFADGNWLLSEGKMNFFVPADIIGINDENLKIISVTIEIDDEF